MTDDPRPAGRSGNDDDVQRPGWVGQVPVAWAIDDAPVPEELALLLIVIARRCDNEGKGSFQGKEKMVAATGKSRAQVHRDTHKLLKLGLIEYGDQNLPTVKYGIPPHKAPTVYNVVMTKKGPKPGRVSKNPSGKRKEVEDAATDDTGGMDATGRMDATPRMDAGGTRRMDATEGGRMDATQIRPSNNPLNNPSTPTANVGDSPPVIPTQRQEEGAGTVEEDSETLNPHHAAAVELVHPYRDRMTISDARNLTRQLEAALDRGWSARLLAAELASDHTRLRTFGKGLPARIKKLGAPPAPHEVPAAATGCTRCGGSGEVWSDQFQTMTGCGACPQVDPFAGLNIQPVGTQRVEWCGKCDQRSRLIDVEVNGMPKVAHCPTCHPKQQRGKEIADAWGVSEESMVIPLREGEEAEVITSAHRHRQPRTSQRGGKKPAREIPPHRLVDSHAHADAYRGSYFTQPGAHE